MAISLPPFSVLWPNPDGAVVLSLQQAHAFGHLCLMKEGAFPDFVPFCLCCRPACAANVGNINLCPEVSLLCSYPSRSLWDVQNCAMHKACAHGLRGRAVNMREAMAALLMHLHTISSSSVEAAAAVLTG